MIASLNPAVTYTLLDGDPTSAICFSIDFLLRDFYNKGLLDKDMVAFCSPPKKARPAKTVLTEKDTQKSYGNSTYRFFL